ncbi:hypothetical protein [Streptomyces sp. NPDC054837]
MRLADEHPAVGPWLLRATVDGDHLNGYFAGRVAEVVGLRDAMTRQAPDADVLDHAGRLLHVMCHCAGMGTPSWRPTYAGSLDSGRRPSGSSSPGGWRGAWVRRRRETPSAPPSGGRPCVGPISLLDREDWCETARAGLVAGDGRLMWLARVAADLELKGLKLKGLELGGLGTGTP